MSLRSLSILALAAFVALAGCGGSGSMPSSTQTGVQSHRRPTTAFNWLQPGIDSTHVADNTAETRLKTRNATRLQNAWTFPTNAGIGWGVMVDGTVAYANSGDGNLYAIDVSSGLQKWKLATGAYGERGLTSAAVAGSLVYVGCNVDGNAQQQGLCAVKRGSGKLAWSWYDDCNCRPATFMITGPVVSGSTVIFGYYTGGAYGKDILVALDATSGTELWSAVTGDGYNSLADSIPAIDGGSVFAGTDYGLCSFQLSGGTLNWCSGPNDLGIAPAIAGGVVYAATIQQGFYAFNETTGAQIWQYSPASGYGSYWNPPAIAGGKAYFATYDSGPIYVLDAASGALDFTAGGGSFNTETLGSPSVANGVLYVTCNLGLCVYNASTGALLASMGGLGNGPPTISNGKVFFPCGLNRSAGVNNVCMYDL